MVACVEEGYCRSANRRLASHTWRYVSLHYPLPIAECSDEACPSGRERQGFGAARGAGGRCQAKGPGQWKPTHSPGQAGGIHARTGATVTRSQLSEVQAPFLWTGKFPCPPALPALRLQHNVKETTKAVCVCCTHPDNNHVIPLPLPSSTSPFSPLQQAGQQHTFSFLYRNHHLYPRLSPLTVTTVNHLLKYFLAAKQVQTALPTTNPQCRTTTA